MSVGPEGTAPLLASHGWHFRVAWARLNAMYGQNGTRKDASLPLLLVNLNQSLESLVPPGEHMRSTRLVIFLGWGVWEFALHKYAGIANVSAHSLTSGLQIALPFLSKLLAGRFGAVDIFVRNMFYSYTRRFGGQKLPPFIKEANDIWRHVADTFFPNEVAVHFLDVWQLSEPRRSEMPILGDGMHWGCVTKEANGSSRCLHELSRRGTRPDEVAWAAVQVALDRLCSR